MPNEMGDTQLENNQLAAGREGNLPNDLAPLNAIRIESVLSKYPMHNLAKKGSINIEIIEKNEYDEIKARWETAPNPKYGEPRQLAYNVDTLIVNRRIDEAERPLPRLIKLGNLTELTQELGYSTKTHNTNKVKRALRQNAFLGIIAKIIYKKKDGTERYIEINDTRYGIIFTGEKLPDGSRADAVYINLHDFYLEVLNDVNFRPLDYDYLALLTPAPRRFYQIISREFYTAIKYGHKEAKLLYSEFCTYSALTRHFDYENFRVQMAKIHKRHFDSGYIQKKGVRYEQTVDRAGKVDWEMYYIPGPKAKAEYETFNPSKKTIEAKAKEADPDPEPGTGETSPAPSFPEVADRSSTQPAKNPDPNSGSAPTDDIDLALLTELTKRGIHEYGEETGARTLIKNKAPDQYIMDQVEFVDSLAVQGKTRTAAGLYIHFIKNNLPIPDTFETSRKRRLREEARQEKDRKEAEKARLELAYDEDRKQTLDTYISKHYPADRYNALIKEKIEEIYKQHKKMLSNWPSKESVDKFLASQADAQVRAMIAKEITFPTLEEFCRIQLEKEAQEREAALAQLQTDRSPAVGEQQGIGERAVLKPTLTTQTTTDQHNEPAASASPAQAAPTTPTAAQPQAEAPAQIKPAEVSPTAPAAGEGIGESAKAPEPALTSSQPLDAAPEPVAAAPTTSETEEWNLSP